MAKNAKRSEKKSGRVPLKEAWDITIRGYKIWWNEYPKMVVSKALSSAADALAPYVGIYFGARIINELAGTRNPYTLLVLVLAALITAAAVTLLGAGLAKWKEVVTAGWWYTIRKFDSQKMLSMDFVSVDDPRTHDLLSQMRQNQQWGGWGMSQLLWVFDALVKSIFTICGAVALSVSLFVLHVPESGGRLTILNYPLFIVLIIALMLVITYVVPMFSNKGGVFWARHADGAKMGNRWFSFFGFMGYDRKRSLDVRVYRQDVLCEKMSKKDGGFGPNSQIARWARGPMGGLNAASGAMSQVFTGIAYIFVCLKAIGGAFDIGSVTQYIGAITALSGGLSEL
ncbi:MAG: ABC transporter ATP-binding protein, partial [Firmicutes bacterium]|nr:ABC transporter ATP-binding protein [Bacillota bacterium]